MMAPHKPPPPYMMDSYAGSTTLQSGFQTKASMTSPIRGDMRKTWFEKSANKAYRQFNSS